MRVLLANSREPAADVVVEESFWADPDVRWLAGVSEAFDEVYFNKEKFEELFAWLQLPGLLALAAAKPKKTALAAIEKLMVKVRDTATKSAYKLREFRALMGDVKAPVKRKAEPAAPKTKPAVKKAAAKKVAAKKKPAVPKK